MRSGFTSKRNGLTLFYLFFSRLFFITCTWKSIEFHVILHQNLKLPLMKYNFDEIIDRHHTDAVKIDALESIWGRTDLTPLWVADMDFRTAPFVIEAIKKRLEHEILGYTVKAESWYTSIAAWLKNRHNWQITNDMLLFTPGIVTGLALAVQCFTQPGDKVMVQPPVYHPFFLVTEHNNREVVFSPLALRDGQYHMDMERFRKDIKGCKMFILCNPHNPGGRVWTKEELLEVSRICHENNVLVVSDEIHADLTLPPYTHHPYAAISEEARTNSVVFMSPSKAFNMAGLSSSFCIIENKDLREKLNAHINKSELGMGHVFAFNSVAAAYSNGTEWLDQLLAYLQENIDFTANFLKENIPAIKAIIPQASYLIFLDCRELGMSQEELVKFFVNDARLALNDGTMFGKEGTGFMRLNIGCPRSVLKQALEQLQGAIVKFSPVDKYPYRLDSAPPPEQ